MSIRKIKQELGGHVQIRIMQVCRWEICQAGYHAHKFDTIPMIGFQSCDCIILCTLYSVYMQIGDIHVCMYVKLCIRCTGYKAIHVHMYIIHACRLKQPEYQHHRESIGAAKTLDQIEHITAEIKSSLLV